MPDPSLLQRLKERKLVQGLLFILAVAIVLVAPPLVTGGLGMALGVLGLISALLLRLGKGKPGTSGAGETPLGMLIEGRARQRSGNRDQRRQT